MSSNICKILSNSVGWVMFYDQAKYIKQISKHLVKRSAYFLTITTLYSSEILLALLPPFKQMLYDVNKRMHLLHQS